MRSGREPIRCRPAWSRLQGYASQQHATLEHQAPKGSFPQDFAVCKGDRLDHLAEKKLKLMYNNFNLFFLDGLGGHPPFAAALSAGNTRLTCGSPKTNASETRDPKTSDPETHDPKTSDPETRDPKTSDPKEAGVREARVQEARVQEARVQEARVQEAKIQNAMPATCQSATL